ncbi:hypothetical protein [Thalassotalea montiporae]
MPKDWIDVADTAVKIGLGSLITGIFTYLGVKFSRKSDRAQFKLEHKTKLLEQISSDAEGYFSAWNLLISPVSAAAKKLPHDEPVKEYPERNLKMIRIRDGELRDSWTQKHAVVSKLSLLKANDASEKFIYCAEAEKELRDALWFDESYLNYNQVEEYRNRVRTLQKDFSEALANYYNEM